MYLLVGTKVLHLAFLVVYKVAYFQNDVGSPRH